MKTSHILSSLLLILSVTGSALAAAPPPTATPAYDIRILIDVSGSMKQNDPANLRKPALRLLTGLLPSGTQAGVWTFGRYVNMLVRHGEVNTDWRERAMDAAELINSAGLFTDIEAALGTASWNWATAAPGIRRSVILLTDGLVDVSTTPESDRLSRARITDEILPRLRDAGVEVYTIALSNDADEPLLRQLSASTGGWFERADDADELERIFLRMFEKAAQPDTLPLIDNQILVDESIEELTLLVFRADGAPATTLTTPDGVTFGAMRLPPNVRWHNEARYDLVTVEKPATGAWRVNADIDPDNRVMVVSNLRVVATQLPNQVLKGDAQDLLVRFTEQNRPITDGEFLHFLQVKALENTAEGATSERLLLDNGRDGDIMPGDGIFGTRLTATGETGAHTVIVDVDGTTFRRRHRQDIEVVESPVIADIRTEGNGPALFVIPRAGIIDPETLEAAATITGDGERGDVLPMVRTSPGEWRLGLEGYPPEGRYRIILEIDAERPNGKPIHYQGEPLHFGRPASSIEARSPDAEESIAGEDPASSEEEAIAEEDPAGEDDAASEAPPARLNWILVVTLVVLLNALLGGVLFLVYRKLFGNGAESAPEATADEDAPSEPAAAPGAPTTAFDDTRPSVVSQIAEAAAATEPGPAAAHEDAPAEMEVMAPAPPDRPDTTDSPAPRPPTDASAPELVMESETPAPETGELDDRLKNLNVEEIDLGFEETTRRAG
ncbi:MAG: VWA domain-containing protein [Gammaproteobacteria bacterium]|nr:VWA domain-containing protein [Gammaproteobacteria bacterium]